MIVTIFHKDGRKERRPIGYTGNSCNEATAPYEVRDLSNQVTKTPTTDADISYTSNDVGESVRTAQ